MAAKLNEQNVMAAKMSKCTVKMLKIVISIYSCTFVNHTQGNISHAPLQPQTQLTCVDVMYHSKQPTPT